MEANAPKRKIFGAVDMLAGDTPTQVQTEAAGSVEMLPVEKIQPSHEHPFRLYEGERLNDMVKSIREHGVLNPVSVWKRRTNTKCLLTTTH